MTPATDVALTAEAVAATYDALAPRWDDRGAGRGPDPRPAWVRRIERFVQAHEPVVELGCGTGVPVGWLLADRYRYIGVDVSRRMIERASELLPTAAFTCADLAAVQFPVESLGAVVSFDAIAHVPRERHPGLMADIARWLRPGGVFVGSLTSTDTPRLAEAAWLGSGPMQWSGFDHETNLELLQAAGFEVIDDTILLPGGSDPGRSSHWFLALRAG